MAKLAFSTILESDLRDSGGHKMKIIEVTGVDGTYTSGGIVINPLDFGFTEIVSLGTPTPMVVFPDEEIDGTWSVIAQVCPMRTDITLDGVKEWRVIVLLHPKAYGGEQGDGVMELADGTPLEFQPQAPLVMTIVGA